MINTNAPVLITAYNRSKNFNKVINSLKFYKTKIYVSIDGPKNNHDKIEQLKIINIINKNKKNLQIKFRVLNKNLGCQKANFSALDWFFLKEERGIILEDDILPTKSFFKFCNKLLIKHIDNEKVFSISGYTPLNKNKINSDYFYSKIFMSWGWATWKSRWLIVKKYKSKNRWIKLLKNKYWNSFLNNKIKRRFFKKIYNLIFLDKINSWAFLWLLIGVANNSKFILPKYNLVKNTGTQTLGANYVPSNFEYANFKTRKIKIENHPNINVYDENLDAFLFNYNFRPKNQLYPWRIFFIIKSLIFDPKFFFIKLFIFIKKKSFNN